MIKPKMAIPPNDQIKWYDELIVECDEFKAFDMFYPLLRTIRNSIRGHQISDDLIATLKDFMHPHNPDRHDGHMIISMLVLNLNEAIKEEKFEIAANHQKIIEWLKQDEFLKGVIVKAEHFMSLTKNEIFEKFANGDFKDGY